MKKVLRILVLTGLLSALSVTAAFADGGESTEAFVCPVLGGQAGEAHGNSSPQEIVQIGGGDYSVITAEGISVPVTATNDDGAGTPGGDHASPGDDGYTAIWAID